jgi:hypothetical protein
MSRGLGRVQRFVLAEVATLPPPDDPSWPFTKLVTVGQLAERLAGGPPTTAQLVAMRRAVRQLAAAGKVAAKPVEVRRRYPAPRCWMTGVRAPLTEEESSRHGEALAAEGFASPDVYGALYRCAVWWPYSHETDLRNRTRALSVSRANRANRETLIRPGGSA